jgi:hypothetical protein
MSVICPNLSRYKEQVMTFRIENPRRQQNMKDLAN